MKELLNITMLLSLAIVTGFAAPLSLFQGTFATDDQAALFNITANTSEAITIETYSYAWRDRLLDRHSSGWICTCRVPVRQPGRRASPDQWNL
jgi:hypothetical protein